MAVVGDAYIVVRAITDRVRDDIRDGFRGADKEGERAGKDVGDGFSRGFSRSGGSGGSMFKNLSANAESARVRLQNLIRVGYALGPALAALGSAVGSAIGGLFALGAQAAAAGPALLSLINIFSAVAQAAAVLKVAFSGIGAALSAGLNSGGGGGGGGGAVDMSRQIEQATERIEDAEKRLAQVQNENVRRVEQARKQVEEAARAVVDAKNDEVEASNAVSEAEADLQKAIQNTNEAREEAREEIQQLNFALEDAILSEERAALKLEDAREALAKVANLPPNNRQRREAQLAYDEAELRLRQAKDNTADTQKEVDEANAKGVEGSDRVLAALEREKDAADNITKAKRDHARAVQAVKDAEEAQTEATQNLNAVLEENKARVEEAKDAIQDAKDALEDLKNSAAGAGGGGFDAFAAAMAKLSPQAQGFVRDLLALAPAWQEIKFATQDALFGTLRQDLEKLTDVWFPKLKELMPGTAKAIGGVATELTNVLTRADNVGRIERIWTTNDELIGDLGGTVANLADSFLILLDHARPLAKELTTWLETLTGGWKESLKAKEKTGELAGIFDYAGKVAKDLGEIFGNLFKAIFNIGKAAAGPGSGGEMLLNMLKDVTAKWEEFTGSADGQNQLAQYFRDIVPVVSELGGLIGDIFREIFQLSGESAGPTAEFIGSLRTAVGTLGDMAPKLAESLPTIGLLIEEVAQIFADLTSSGAIDQFFKVLLGAAEIAGKIVGSEAFKTVYGLAAPILATASALGLVFTAGKFLFMGLIVGPIMKVIGFFGLLGKAIGGIPTLFYRIYSAVLKFGAFFGKVFGGLIKLMGPVIGILQKVALAIRAVGLAFLTPPVGLIIGIIALIIGAIILLYQNNETFRNFVISVWEKIQEIIGKVAEWFQNTVMPIIQTVIDNIVSFFQDTLLPIIQTVWSAILTAIETVVNWFRDTVWPIIQVVIDLIVGYYKLLWEGVKLAWDIIYGAIEFVVNWFRDTVWPILQVVIDLIVGYYKLLWEGVKLAWDLIYGAIEFVVNWFRDTVWPIIQTVVDLVVGYYRFLWDVIKFVWDAIYGAIETVVNWFRDTAWPIIQSIIDLIKSNFEIAQGIVETVWKAIETAINNVATWFRDTLWPIIQSVIGFIQTGYENLQKGIETAWKAIETAIDAVGKWLKETLQPIITGVWDKIKETVETLKTKVSDAWDGIKSGIDTAATFIKDKIISPLKDSFESIATKINDVKTKVLETWETLKTKINEAVTAVTGKVGAMWDGLYSGLTGAWASVKSWWNANVARSIDIPIPFRDPVTIRIPTLAEGGIIQARQGGTLALIGEAGRNERVEPLDENGLSNRDKALIDYLSGGRGGGMTINVYPSPGMDERELAQKVSRELALQIRRGAI